MIDPGDLDAFVRAAVVDEWGAAACPTTPWPYAPALPVALSLGMRLEPRVIAPVEAGPTPEYFAEYTRLKGALNEAADAIAGFLREQGAAAVTVPSTVDADSDVIDWTDARVFAHKTAATQAGLGWIGKTAIYVSGAFGPWIRLATVFTDAELPTGEPITAGRCGGCRRCVDACPTGAGRDVTWRAGMPRDELLDAVACQRENASNIPTVGDICGVCLAVCPVGRRLLHGQSDAEMSASEHYVPRDATGNGKNTGHHAGDGPDSQTSPQAKEREWERWSS